METSEIKLEKMNLQLARLLYDYSIKGRLADEDYAMELLKLFVNGRGLKEYVKVADIHTKHLDVFNAKTEKPQIAEYDKEKKAILLAPSQFEKAINKGFETSSDIEKFLLYNSCITSEILRAIEYADQERIIATSDSVEAKILKLAQPNISKFSISELFAPDGKTPEEDTKYTVDKIMKIVELRDYVPQERMAEIKAWQQIVDALEMAEISDELIECERISKVDAILTGYDVPSPTIHYLRKIGKEASLKTFDWYSANEAEALEKAQKGYTLKKRMLYGLPTTARERNDYTNQIMKVEEN